MDFIIDSFTRQGRREGLSYVMETPAITFDEAQGKTCQWATLHGHACAGDSTECGRAAKKPTKSQIYIALWK
jgi:hypothetical protein